MPDTTEPEAPEVQDPPEPAVIDPEPDGPGELPEGFQPIEPFTQEDLTPSLTQIQDILQGRSAWGNYVQEHAQLQDVKEALEIVYRYHPGNDGTNPRSLPVTLGDVGQMREDLMHLSALSVRISAMAAIFEGHVESIDQERRLARSRAWSRIRKSYKSGEKAAVGRVTNDMLDHEANASVQKFYHLQSDLTTTGKILSWSRLALRDHCHMLQTIIRSSFREEMSDANLH